MTPAATHIRREAVLGLAINGLLSAAFFLGIFGRPGTVPLWGGHGLVVDCLPQGFMIGLMSTLVPGLLAQRGLRAGRLARLPGAAWGPRPLAARALLLALASALLAGLVAAVLAWLSGAAALAFWPGLVAKVAGGSLLGALVTSIGLSATLRA